MNVEATKDFLKQLKKLKNQTLNSQVKLWCKASWQRKV